MSTEVSVTVAPSEVVAAPAQFFVQKSKDAFLDEVLDSTLLTDQYPDIYRPRFDAIADIRRNDPDGDLYRGSEFRHVASFVNIPLMAAVNLFDPDFMKNKGRFYGFLRRNKEYCTYNIRRHAVGNPDIHTFIEGKPV